MSALTGRVAKWDNTKAILIFLVVFGHGITPFIKDHEAVRSVFLWLTFFHMPLFMFLTGLFSKGFVKAPRFKTEKIASYILLYFFMKLLNYVTLAVMTGNAQFKWLSESGSPWYIFVTAVFMVLTRLIRNFNTKKVFAVSVMLALAVGYISEIGDVFVLSRIFVFYPWFYAGYMADKDKLLAFVNKLWVKLCSAAVLILFTAAVLYLGDRIYSIRYVLTGNNPYSEFGADWQPFGAFLRLGCYGASTVVSLALLSLAPSKRVPLVTNIGANTLTVYALHRPVLYILQYTVMEPFMADFSQIGILALLVACCAVISFVLSLKPFSWVLWPCISCGKWLSPLKRWLQK